MSISNSLSTSRVGLPRFLVQNLQFNFRSSATSEVNPSPSQSNASVDRIQVLTSQIKDLYLGSLGTDGNSGDSSVQSSVDAALAEISQLLGSPLALGGAKNAVIKGLNSNQIEGVEVFELPPNAATRFSGGRTIQAKPARTTVDNTSDLLGYGGELEFNVNGSRKIIGVADGASLDSLVRRINAKQFGVRASAAQGKLRVTSDNSAFTVASRAMQRHSQLGAAQVSGSNPLQISNVDTSNYTGRGSTSISGTRDRFSTAAELGYQGDESALVSGSATFDLAGSLGTASFSISKGESLQAVADRINADASTTGVLADVVDNQLLFRSNTKGAEASVQIQNVVRDEERSVSPINASQVENFSLADITANTEVNLVGEITKAADSAELIYRGGGGAVVVDSVTFTLTGMNGSSQFTIAQNESLSGVRDRINQETSNTGVEASVVDDDLVFRSTQVGSSQSISVELDDIAQDVEVSGVSSSELSRFEVISSSPDSTNTLTGTVTRTATAAQLTYTGFLGASASSSEFVLTGDQGSATISVEFLQSLDSVRDSINAVKEQTGVVATGSGNTLTLTSVGEGSTASVHVDVLSGAFDTNGGDGNGYAVGLDAEATFNGTTITGEANDFIYSDALGTYSFSVQRGFIGSITPVTVSSTAVGEFVIEGGDNAGTAMGVDAEAILNDQLLVGSGNDFNFSLDGASGSFSSVSGFIGLLDTITLSSVASEFGLVGGDENNAAFGQDGTATINGWEYSSADDQFTVSTDGGDVTLDFASDFLGSFDTVSIHREVNQRQRHLSPVASSGVRSSSAFEYDGARVSPTDGRYIIEQDGIKIAIDFAKGFSGQFDDFTVAAAGETDSSAFTKNLQPLTGAVLQTTKDAVSNLFQLASGGRFSGLGANAAAAFSIVTETISKLRRINGEPMVRGRSIRGVVLDQFA